MLTNAIFKMGWDEIYQTAKEEIGNIQYIRITQNAPYYAQTTPAIIRAKLISVDNSNAMYTFSPKAEYEILGVNFLPKTPDSYKHIKRICEVLPFKSWSIRTYEFVEKPDCYFYTVKEMEEIAKTMKNEADRKFRISLHEQQKELIKKAREIKLNSIISAHSVQILNSDPYSHEDYYIINNIIEPTFNDISFYPYVTIQGYRMIDGQWYNMEYNITEINDVTYIPAKYLISKYSRELYKMLQEA